MSPAKYVKHPRTLHLPFSPGVGDDDLVMDDVSGLLGDIVVTEKMDGENTTMYDDYIHARAVDSSNHESRAWVKNLWSQIAHDVPSNMRICGENLYAEHSIHYSDLPTFFMVHSVWEDDRCLSWDDTETWCALLGLQTVPVLARGSSFEMGLPASWGREGYVVRYAGSFPMSEYPRRVAKSVRANHVQTDEHWTRTWKPNELDLEV